MKCSSIFLLIMSWTEAMQHIPPAINAIVLLGHAADDEFNVNVHRDGGGGGHINGYNFLVFSDSSTVQESANTASRQTSFAHNTVSFFGAKNKTNPAQLTDFGISKGYGASEFTGSVVQATQDNETVPEKNFAIWSDSDWVKSSDPTKALGVMTAIDESLPSLVSPGDEIYYTTMVLLDIIDPTDIPDGQTVNATRVVPQLFYPTENLYGSFSLLSGYDQYLYLFARMTNTPDSLGKGVGSGIGVSRVSLGDATDRTKYTYWNGAEWTQTMPAVGDSSTNLFNFTDPQFGEGPSTGDVWYSDFHQTFISVFMDASVAGQFWITWAEQGNIDGTWATPEKLYTTPLDPTCDSGDKWNYAGHVYPAWDPIGESLLLSWSSCNEYINMAQISWS